MSTEGKKVYKSPKRQKIEKKIENKNNQKEAKNRDKPVYVGPPPRNHSTPTAMKPQKKYEVIPEDLSAFII